MSDDVKLPFEPYYQDESVTIYNADCREVLPFLPKFDLLLTDPPYGISYVTSMRSRSDKLRKRIENDSDLSVVEDAWKVAFSLLNEDRHWYAFASPRMIPCASKVFIDSKHIIAWDKGDRGTVGDLKCGFGEAWEAIFYGMKGRREIRGSRPRTVIRKDWSSTMDPQHPTVKPIELLRKLVCWSTDEGETVLDPFAGSGTTGVACKLEGRKATLIEIDEGYCEKAAKRLKQGVLF